MLEQNLSLYRIFYAVARNKNITKAGEELFISQPAISKGISKLEASLNCTLFLRTSRGVSLTKEGELLYHHIHSAFSSIEAGEYALKQAQDLKSGEIRIGVSSTLCRYILMPYLKKFIEQYPQISITIECNPTYQTIELLKDKKVDIGFICKTETPKHFIYHEIQTIQDTFIATEAYLNHLNASEDVNQPSMDELPFFFSGNITSMLSESSVSREKVTRSEAVVLKETMPLSTTALLERGNLMLLEKNNITRMHVDFYLTEHNIHPKQILEVTNMDLLMDFAKIGMGISCVIKEFAKKELQSGEIQELKLEHPLKKRSIGFLYPDPQLISHASRMFLKFTLNTEDLSHPVL